MHDQVLVDHTEECLRCCLVMSVQRGELGDQNAGVEDDHSVRPVGAQLGQVVGTEGARVLSAARSDRLPSARLLRLRAVYECGAPHLDEVEQQPGPRLTRPADGCEIERMSDVRRLGHLMAWAGCGHTSVWH
jgi:hypothetical protein